MLLLYPGSERKSSQPTLTLTPENAALLPSGSSDAACSPIQEEGGELDHREGGHLIEGESEREDPSEVAETEGSLRTDRIKLPADELAAIEAIAARKHEGNMVLMAKNEYPYGPRKLKKEEKKKKEKKKANL